MSRLVFIRSERLILAELLADKIAEYLQDDSSRDLYAAGAMCEQGVLTYLKDRQVLYKPSVSGSDDGDFQIKLSNGMWITADVKLNLTEQSDVLLVPMRQAIKRAYHIYIGARYIHDQQVEILGYCHPEDLEYDPDNAYQKHYPTLHIDYDDLWDIQHLHERIAEGHPVEQYPQSVIELYSRNETAIIAS